MENIDFSKAMIRNSEFYNGEAAYVGFFKKNGIVTLEQLLDEKLMSSVLKDCRTFTKVQIELLISLIKFKYFGISLPNSPLLSKRVESSGKGIVYFNDNTNTWEALNVSNLIGISPNKVDLLRREVSYGVTEVKKEKRLVSLYDVFKFLALNNKVSKSSSLAIIKAYVLDYDKNFTLRKEDLESLKVKLVELIQARESIDREIRHIEDRLSLLGEEDANSLILRIKKENA